VRGVLVGRFQPFHRGHLELVRRLVRAPSADPLLVAIGSAEQSFTWENPFTAGERFEMIDRALTEARVRRVTIVPVPDIQRHGLWVRYLEGLLPRFDRAYSHNPLTLLLFERAGYATERPALIDRRRFEGVRIREKLARGEDVRALVPPAVDRYLRELHASDRLARLRPGAAPGRHRTRG
jgi:nicotinamide-nucleotide adenylyltransferase